MALWREVFWDVRVLQIAMVAMRVLPEAVGAQISWDLCFRRSAWMAFSWMGVRELSLE